MSNPDVILNPNLKNYRIEKFLTRLTQDRMKKLEEVYRVDLEMFGYD